jgi:DNA polymerase
MTIRVPPQLPASGRAKIAFVGEAPSDEELDKLQPLVGPAGRVFNAMLRNANLERSEYLITNVFDEQAEDNDVAKAGWLKDEARIAENFARLNAELTAAQPNVIVPMGATAMWAFTGINSISNYRGAVTKATRLMEGAKLVPTYHPAAVMRNWQLLPIGVKDFEKAAMEADLGPKIVYPKLEIYVEPNVRDVQQFVAEAHESGKLSVDIETGWGQITSIAFAPTPSRAFAVPFVDLRKPNKSYWPTDRDERDVWLAVRDILEYGNPKVGQNYMYDLFWLYMQKGIATRNYRYDTRLRHKVLFPELPADLANMAATYTRIGAWKMWGGRYQKATEKKDG